MKESNGFSLSTSVSDGIIEIVITGELTTVTINKLHEEVIRNIRETNAKAVICDVRNLKGPQEIVDAYFRARSLPTNIKTLPAAIIDRSGNREFKSFYVTTSANVGQTIKWFTDIKHAREWLKTLIDK